MKPGVTFFQKLVYEATRKIPKGRVATYGQIARFIDNPKAARAVGNALNRNPFAPASTRNRCLSNRGKPRVPCHRVVASDGSIGGFASGPKKKAALLKTEGIKVRKGRLVDFSKKLLVKIR